MNPKPNPNLGQRLFCLLEPNRPRRKTRCSEGVKGEAWKGWKGRGREGDIRLNPNIQITNNRIPLPIHTRRNIISTRIPFVYIMLRDRRPDHGRGPGHEAPEDLFERGEFDAEAGEEGVELRGGVRRSASKADQGTTGEVKGWENLRKDHRGG